MKKSTPIKALSFAFGLTVLLASCKKDPTHPPAPAPIAVSGIYILNEGVFGGESSLSYYGYVDNKITHNVYAQNNPDNQLGSGANDIEQYGSMLYMTVDFSNKVVVARAEDAKHVKNIDVSAPRFIASHSGKVFITSYTGSVFVVDTASLTVIKEIKVGRTPEQIVAAGNKLYVANSGWQDAVFSGGEYDNTVSVIDPMQLTEERKIKVADNITGLLYDGFGHVLASSVDIFVTFPTLLKPSRLHIIQTSNYRVDTLNYGAQQMALGLDKTVYLTKSEDPLSSPSLFRLNMENLELIEFNPFPGIVSMYALGVDPDSGDIWIGDALDYANPGKVYRYDAQTKQVSSFTAGYLPKAFLFKR